MDNVVVLLIMIASMAIFWSCVCRLRMTHRDVFPRVRYRYVLIGTGALFSAFGHWVFPIVNGELYGLCIFVLTIAVGFWLDRKDWKDGPPPSATEPGGLRDEWGNEVK